MFTVEDARTVAACMGLHREYPDVQVSQTLFRLRVVDGWQIPAGARVLEIGCGQGDMTAALAYAVGSSGRVTAVDSASEEYGSPLTIGDSARHLKASSLGQRIDFRFKLNLLDPAISFPDNSFDYVALAHSSWYLDALDHLGSMLTRVRPWARRLCLSEWDLVPVSLDQVAHMLAVLIQGQTEACKRDSESNVRTLYTRSQLEPMLEASGWCVTCDLDLDSSVLKDADWEIENCLRTVMHDAQELKLPAKHIELLISQLDLLSRLAGRGANKSLGSFSILAE